MTSSIFACTMEQNAKDIYGHGDLQEKRKPRVQFQHFSHNVAIINVRDYHSIRESATKVRMTNSQKPQGLAQFLTYGSVILWYNKKCTCLMFVSISGTRASGTLGISRVIGVEGASFVIHNKPLFSHAWVYANEITGCPETLDGSRMWAGCQKDQGMTVDSQLSFRFSDLGGWLVIHQCQSWFWMKPP